jgi:hypothetical protein
MATGVAFSMYLCSLRRIIIALLIAEFWSQIAQWYISELNDKSPKGIGWSWNTPLTTHWDGTIYFSILDTESRTKTFPCDPYALISDSYVAMTYKWHVGAALRNLTQSSYDVSNWATSCYPVLTREGADRKGIELLLIAPTETAERRPIICDF